MDVDSEPPVWVEIKFNDLIFIYCVISTYTQVHNTYNVITAYKTEKLFRLWNSMNLFV